MCVIIQIPAKTILSYDRLKNATLNNPDGFGIVFRDRGKLEDIHNYSPNGNDPEAVYKRLTDGIDTDRYLHLRKNTVGDNKIENTHPFKVMSGDRQVFFFHNGTIGSYTTRPEGKRDYSDTRWFAEDFLSPLLYKLKGEKGFGDYTDPFFQKVLRATFSPGYGRLLLISNDLDNFELGDWKTLLEKEEGEEEELSFRVSNLDYFNTVQTSRMSEAMRSSHTNSNFRANVEKANAEASQAAAAKTPNVSGQLANLKDVNLSKLPGRSLRPEDTSSLASYLSDNIEDIAPEELALCSYLTGIEIFNWVSKNAEAASILLEQMFIRYAELLEEFDSVDEQRVESNEKHEKATARIADLTNEIKQLQSLLGSTKKEPANDGKVVVRKRTRNAVAVKAVEEQVA